MKFIWKSFDLVVPFVLPPGSNRKKWIAAVMSLVPEGFCGEVKVFRIIPESEGEDDLSTFPLPVLSFNGYGKEGFGLGSLDVPEDVPRLALLREDLVLFCRYIIRLAGRPVETFYLSNDPDSPEILTMEFEYGASNPGSFNVEVSPTGRICLPYIEDPFSIHDLWVTLPSLGWVPVLTEVFMQEARIEKLQVLPRSQ